MNEANLKRTALTLRNTQLLVQDPQKLATDAQSKTAMTAKRKDMSDTGSSIIAESTNNQTKKPKSGKTLSLSRKSKKVQPDGKKQLSMDKFVIKSPRASLSPNDKSGCADINSKTMDLKAAPDDADTAKQTQAASDTLGTCGVQQESAHAEKNEILHKKCDIKAKQDAGAGKKKKKLVKKQGDAKIVKKKKKVAKLAPIPVDPNVAGPIPVNLNVAELAVNDMEVPAEVPTLDYPVTPSKGRIEDYGQLTKLLRTPVKVSTPMPDYAIREEEGLADFPDPLGDTDFENDCNVLRNAFEEGVVDNVDTCIAERMFYRYMPFLEAIQNNTLFSMRQEEYCQNFKRGRSMDFAPGCIIISDRNLQKLMKLMGKNFTIDDDDNLNKVQYFMLVLIPELITKIVMGVYQVNKREAIQMKKEIAIKVTELMGDAIFRL